MSSDDIVLSVKNVSKCFEMYEKPRHRLFQMLFNGKKTFYEEFWALKDINFELKRGESVGIIGRNGAGKSTLLQIITGTLQPTTGKVAIKGRVAALLELGSGFSPEFTGRENVYMNATILGLSKAEIDAKYDEIVEFADIGEFIHQPVKHYSSGMMVRLAFAVNACIEPDILIVDEALAVGDIAFQRNCYARLEELKKNGTTIVLVTHALDDVTKHCSRTLLLEQGKQLYLDESRHIVNVYRDMILGASPKHTNTPSSFNVKLRKEANADIDDRFSSRPMYQSSEYRWGVGGAKIIDFRVTCNKDIYPGVIESGAMVSFQFRTYFERDVANVIFGFLVKTVDGINLFGTNTQQCNKKYYSANAGDTIDCEFSMPMMLNTGKYFISFGVSEENDCNQDTPLDRRYDGVMIDVVHEYSLWGLIDMNANCKVDKL